MKQKISLTFSRLAFALLFANVSCNSQKPSVIIVGAGPSGIAAAAKLLENNVSDVTILEAEGRIGGRINSVEFGDAVVDLGAQWCHGQENNIVYELIKDLNLVEGEPYVMTVYDLSELHIDPSFGNELFQLFNDILEVKNVDDGISLGEYIIERYNKTVYEYFGGDADKLKAALEGITVMNKYTLSLQGAFSWFDPSANSDYTTCEGNPVLNWKGKGYKTILDVLTKRIPDLKNELPVYEKVVLNKEVNKILWDSDTELPQDVTVTCSDGSVYTADYVIFTASLGVLKHDYSTLFEPSLPESKINAIKQLGIGAASKVFFYFPNRWWPEGNFTDFTLLWNQKDMEHTFEEFSEGPSKDGKSWITDILGFYAVPGNPNALVMWICGEFVPEVELSPDETVLNGAMFTLNKFLGYRFNNITKPDRLVRHNWYSNPHFRGAYSYQTVESRKQGISQEVVLSQPLTSSHGQLRILFAGEAAHTIYYGTVHGAIETGFREADRILSLLKSLHLKICI